MGLEELKQAGITLILYICFGVYLGFGVILMSIGGWYWSNAGAVGATAVYLLLVGFIMLIIGGISLWANFKGMWFMLFLIELFNIALFLVCAHPVAVPHKTCAGRQPHIGSDWGVGGRVSRRCTSRSLWC